MIQTDEMIQENFSTGLLMLIGLILYISIFKAEVGSKLRPKSSLQPAVFSYRYGYSFILYIVGILLVFCSGILNVFLYTGFHNEPTFSRSVKVNFFVNGRITSLFV